MYVQALVRCAISKRFIERLPELTLMTPSPLELQNVQIQTGYTGRRVNNSRFQFLGAQGGYLSDLTQGNSLFL